MSATPGRIIEYLRTIDKTYVDCRVITEQEMRALVWFFLYGENVFSELGHHWRGATFRQSNGQCLLVVKAGSKDIPQVAFTTDRNPTGCVLAFCKAWHNDRVKWVDDQYP